MFTEREMRSRIRRLWFKIHRHRGFDVLVTHSPAVAEQFSRVDLLTDVNLVAKRKLAEQDSAKA